MKKVKILYIVKSGDFGGVQSHLLNLIEYLNRDIFDISVCIPPGPLIAKLRLLNVKIIRTKFVRYKISFLSDLITFLNIFNIIRKGDYDIVHPHCSKPGVFGRIAAKLLMVKVIIFTPHLFHFRESFSYFKKMIFMKLEKLLSSKFTDMVISVSDNARRDVVEKGIIQYDKIVTIPNGINPASFHDDIDRVRYKKRKELRIPEDENVIVIGMIARLMPQKNPEEFLLAAARILKKLETETYFILIGDGILKQELIRKRDELKIGNRLYLLGSRDDIPELLKVMNIFVITSLWEGLPMTILEAMASELPIIATDISGNNEIIINGVTGVLYPQGCIDALSNEIIKLIHDPDSRIRMGKAGRKRIEKNYHVKRMVCCTENLYLALLKKHRK